MAKDFGRPFQCFASAVFCFALVLGRTMFEVRSFWEVRNSILEDELKVRKVQIRFWMLANFTK